MRYTDEHLDEAVKNNIFAAEQVEQFRQHVQRSDKQVTKFQKVLYYTGALLIISAMTWLMLNSWDSFGAIGVSVISAVYFVLFLIAGYFVLFKKRMEIAGGLLFTVPIAVTPLFIFSVLDAVGIWQEWGHFNDFFVWIRGRWIVIELGTIFVALIILIKTKFPFHVFLISVALWFFSMDIVAVINSTVSLTWEQQLLITKIFGLCMVVVGYFADLKFEKDYSFWLYLFGSMTFLAGLSNFSNNNVFGFLLLGFASVLMMLFSLFINRNVILVFGSIGIIQLLSRLSWEVFRHSVLFPFALTAIGISLILAGIYLQKNRHRIEESIIRKLPHSLLELRPQRKTS